MGWLEDKVEQLAATAAAEGEKTRLVMQALLAETQRGVRIAGALARPIRPNALNYSAGRRLLGWSLIAVGGTSRIILHDGQDTSGDVVAVIDLADGENQTTWLGPGGVNFGTALYAEVIGAGVLTGSVYLGPID